MLGLLWFLAVIAIIAWLVQQPNIQTAALGSVSYTECAVPVIRPHVELPPRYQQIKFANLTQIQKTDIVDKNI